MSTQSPPSTPLPPPSKNFLSARLRSFHYAFSGLSYLLRTQPNARLHALATLLVLSTALPLHLSKSDWCFLTAAIAAVWIAEAFNTSLELLADALHPSHHPLIAHAKDTAAAAVLLASLASTTIGLLILLPRLLLLIPAP